MSGLLEACVAHGEDGGGSSSPSSGGSEQAQLPEPFEGARRRGWRPATMEPEGHRSGTVMAESGGCAAGRLRGEAEETPQD
jgi:hypothetical protein